MPALLIRRADLLKLLRAHEVAYLDMIAKSEAALDRSYRLLAETEKAVRDVKLPPKA